MNVLATAMLFAALAVGYATQVSNTHKISGDQPKYALLVGISKYKDRSLNPIDGCENNVPLLAQTLIDNYGFKKGDVHTLLNDQAGKSAIISEFRSHLIDNARKAKKDGKEAVIVYYFCGHGSQYPDQDGDENDGLDETFVAYDSRTGGTPDILDDEIDDLKAELRPFTTNTTLILESCHSGTGSRGDGDKEYTSEEADEDTQKYPPYKRKYPPSNDADADTYTEIAASASTNTAKSETREYCNCDKPYSLMTKALVEALKPGKLHDDLPIAGPRGLERRCASARVRTRRPRATATRCFLAVPLNGRSRISRSTSFCPTTRSSSALVLSTGSKRAAR